MRAVRATASCLVIRLIGSTDLIDRRAPLQDDGPRFGPVSFDPREPCALRYLSARSHQALIEKALDGASDRCGAEPADALEPDYVFCDTLMPLPFPARPARSGSALRLPLS